MKNDIGVIIATYNGEKYIESQLESILNQSIKPNMIIISDGGSSDNTINICRKKLKNSNINFKIYSSKKNLNVKENFEKAFRLCTCRYIFFSDQDDYWLPNKIKNSMDVFYQEKPILVFSNAYITNEKLEKTGKNLWNVVGYKPKNKITVYTKCSIDLLKILIKHNVVTGMCIAIDSKNKEQFLPFSNYSIHDVWLAHVSNFFGKVVSLNEKDVLYRQHGNNAIGTKKSIKNSIKHRKNYLFNINRLANFYSDMLSRFDINGDLKDYYINKLKFLNKRSNYIKKNSSFLSIFSMLIDYYKYEYSFFEIILKDLYTRINYKKGKNDNEY